VRADDHESASPKISGLGVNHGEGKAHGHGSVDGIAAALKDLAPDLACNRTS
jgi:hypothetical protein